MEEGTILIGKDTRQLLKQMGKKGQTYDQLIKALINLNENKPDSLEARSGNLQSSESGNA
jgi:hypothetical protein